MSCYSKLLKNSAQYTDVLRYVQTGLAPSGITGLPNPPKAHLIHSLCEDLSRRAVVVLPDEASARKFTADVNEFAGVGKKAFFFTHFLKASEAFLSCLRGGSGTPLARPWWGG